MTAMPSRLPSDSRFTRDDAIAYFNQMIGDIRNPRRYAAWMVPVVSARVP